MRSVQFCSYPVVLLRGTKGVVGCHGSFPDSRRFQLPDVVRVNPGAGIYTPSGNAALLPWTLQTLGHSGSAILVCH